MFFFMTGGVQISFITGNHQAILYSLMSKRVTFKNNDQTSFPFKKRAKGIIKEKSRFFKLLPISVTSDPPVTKLLNDIIQLHSNPDGGTRQQE